MDFTFVHLDTIARRCPHCVPLRILVYDPYKETYVRHTFNTTDFPVILRGEGVYKVNNKTWLLKSPCIFRVLPGARIEYRPDPGYIPNFLDMSLDFVGPLYFSRKSKDIVGQSASHYRKQHKFSLNLRDTGDTNGTRASRGVS